MEEKVLKYGRKLLQQQKRRKRRYKAVSILSVLVIFCTAYALISPAITMEETAYCGKEEHQHSATCYTKELICELPIEETNAEVHEHTDGCYETVLVCSIEEHTHTRACYSNDDADLETESEEESINGYETLAAEESIEDIEESAETISDTPESEQQEEVQTLALTAEGDDYTVVVSYTDEAEIPEEAVLEVREYAADSQKYQTRFKEANSVLLAQDGSCIHRARFFDISIMDGETEIEPKAAVQVEISQSLEIAEEDEDIIITHTDSGGTEIISEVKVTQEENGYVTAGFETESFSDYGTITAGESITIGIGDTVTLEGSSGNRNNWSFDSEGYVEIQESGNNAVITGTATGMVTITHIYTNKGASETFTVVVIDNSDIDNSDTEKKAVESGYTVTIKGNKKVLTDDVILHVEDYNTSEEDYQNYYDALVADLARETSASISDDSFDFLQMYHIYLTKEGQDGEYVPEDNVNIQVTITYDTAPANWEKVNWVGHYKKTNGMVSGVEVSDGSSSSTGVKQIKVSGNSIIFHIQSFSVFPIAALSTGFNGGSASGGTVAKADGSILTSEQLSWIGNNNSNEWQIVNQEYSGNTRENKKESTDGKVRVQKNVIPTDVENEFLVYLSIDTKQLFADFFASARYKATTSNNYHDKDLGTIVTAMTGNQNVDVVGNTTRYTNHANFTILSSQGELLADNITLYWSQANNVTIYLEVNEGSTKKYVLVGVEIIKNDNEVVMLSEESEKLIMSNIAQMADLGEVTDTMGDYVDFVSVVSGNYNTTPVYDDNTHTLTWIPAIKTNPTIDKVQSDESKTVTWTDHDGNVRTETVYKYTSWALNVSELVYKVKLNVAKAGFNSAADNLSSQVGEAESYSVNNSAVLTYGESSAVDFQVPYVRGLLYDIQFDKVDADDTTKKLSGAEFALTDTFGNTYVVTEDETNKGTYRAIDLPWGNYTLTEITPPVGYKKSTTDPESWEIGGSYTTNRMLEQDSDRSDNMLFTGKSNPWQIKNEKMIYVDLIKTDMSYEAVLDGAKFSIYDTNPSGEGAEAMEGYAEILVSEGIIADNLEVEDGKTYYLVETEAPDGYDLPSNNVITLTVNMANTTTSGPIAVNGGAGEAEKTSETQIINKVETTVYVIKIPNNPGVELPETGGIGTLPYTLGGLGLVLASSFMYGYRMRRKRERGIM